MRCTKEVLEAGKECLNEAGYRMLSVRGYKLEVLENLGVLKDAYESLDFSENALTVLDGFPPMPRLRQLILSQNNLCRVSEGLGDVLPNLESLVLTGNLFTDAAHLQPLAQLKQLRRLTLLDNPLTANPNYRQDLLHRLPQLRFLDFQKT